MTELSSILSAVSIEFPNLTLYGCDFSTNSVQSHTLVLFRSAIDLIIHSTNQPTAAACQLHFQPLTAVVCSLSTPSRSQRLLTSWTFFCRFWCNLKYSQTLKLGFGFALHFLFFFFIFTLKHTLLKRLGPRMGGEMWRVSQVCYFCPLPSVAGCQKFSKIWICLEKLDHLHLNVPRPYPLSQCGHVSYTVDPDKLHWNCTDFQIKLCRTT